MFDENKQQQKAFAPDLKRVLLSRQLLDETIYEKCEKKAQLYQQNIEDYLYKSGLIPHKALQLAIATAQNINIEFIDQSQHLAYDIEQEICAENGYHLIKNYQQLNRIQPHSNQADSVGFSENSTAEFEPQTFVTARDFRQLFIDKNLTKLNHQAANLLADKKPNLTAKHGLYLMQKCLLILLLIGIITAFSINFLVSFYYICLALSGLFIFASIIKTYSLFLPQNLDPETEKAAQNLNHAELPIYSILVPLFKEAKIIGRLTDNLLKLNYPHSKLDIKLLFEENDHATIAAAKALNLPECFEFIIVKNSQPRTKPKAMNFALPFVQGKYITIYDAEDKPEPDQLLKAVAKFELQDDDVACLQASLEFENWDENWLSRHFFIEYATQFNRMLPCLERLNLPLPLGGTSNHFKTSILRELYGWDAYNVTEDADLGIRLALAGYRSKTLCSVTLEEANHRLLPWISQRTRWIKGWIQTAIVHSRRPTNLLHAMDFSRYLGFVILLLNMILSSLLHPLSLILPFWLYWHADFALIISSSLHFTLFAISIGAFVIGHGATLMANFQGIAEFKRWKLIITLMTAPLYWLLISISAWWAIIEYVRRPFYWAKTEHGVSKMFDNK